MAQELELGRPKYAFLGVDDQAKLLKALKEFPEVTLMILWIGTRDEDVVDIGKHSREPARYLGNESLERLSCVA